MKFIRKSINDLQSLPDKIKNLGKTLVQLSRFFVLLQFFLLDRLINWLTTKNFFPQFFRSFLSHLGVSLGKLINIVDASESDTISQIEIIKMSLQNMTVKKSRTAITIGGMCIGIATIVFLISIGYGLQNLVVSRIARLEEMKQAEIMPNEQSQIYVDDKALSDFERMNQVEKVSPLISLVGRINFRSSVTDVVVHGVTGEYLKSSALQPIEGVLFDNNQVAKSIEPEREGQVAGVKTEIKERKSEIGSIFFTINPEAWLRVRSGPTINSEILGYTRRVEGVQDGKIVWGEFYELGEETDGEVVTDGYGNQMRRWIQSEFPLWKWTNCDSQESETCEAGYEKIEEDGQQVWEEAYTSRIGLTVQELPELNRSRVLGESTQSALLTENTATSGANLIDQEIDQEILELIGGGESEGEEAVKQIALNERAQKEAVVNEAMVQVLGESRSEIIGKEFDLSFVASGDTLSTYEQERVESKPEKYKVVGVLPGDQNPVVYVPFIDLRSLGIDRFSQARVTVSQTNELSEARQMIEAMGYGTSSVADTVEQVINLFATLRLVLGILGLVALAVASLGMFNTLTVSLLERTREVGVLKSMGMKSHEVKNLFLTESMVMGFFGGILGIVVGIAAGKTVGLLLSILSVAQGVGFINVSTLPLFFALLIIFLSLIVGFVTGIYPAKRATKISALNALRYE